MTKGKGKKSSKVSPKAPSGKARTRRARPMARSVVGQVEARYLRALYDPFNAEPCRFPDMLSVPTAVTSSILRFPLTAVTQTGGASTGISVNVYPQLGSTAYTGNDVSSAKASIAQTISASGVPSNWAFYNDPLRGTGAASTGAAFANMAGYRTVAMGFRLRNVTAELNRGGIGAFRMSTTPVDVNPDTYTFTDVASSREGVVFDAASIGAAGKYWVWHPENYTQDVNFAATDSTNFQPTLQFRWVGQGAIAQSFEAEVVTFYEFVPRPSVEMLFDLASEIGSPARVEMLNAEIIQRSPGAPPSADPNFAQQVVKAVDSVLGPVIDTPGRVLHAARRLRQSVVRSVAGSSL
jgi:hypothetical protein